MYHNDNISHNTFRRTAGDTEHFIVIQAPPTLDFREQVEFVQKRYRETQEHLGLTPATAVFHRIFLSDVLNHAAFVRGSDLCDDSMAVSIVQQPPLQSSKIALLAYHIKSPDPLLKRRLSRNHLLVQKQGRRHLWSTRLCTCDTDMSISPEKQTHTIFTDLVHTLATQGANLRDHCVRTWLFMKDVDIFYKGMVDERREIFAHQGMTDATHYISSTGIEGACTHRFDLISMDAYSCLDLVPAQMSFLNDFERLCATKDYNVTFERGTRIAYADRMHYFISGTASIDKTGEVVYPGEVLLQLEHTLANIEALLQSGSASLADIMYLIVYLRDPSDFMRVNEHLRNHFAELPVLIVQGAVCRPEWLVEAEGVAITTNHDPALPLF